MVTDPDDPDLRERVAELEATVEQQQATIQQLLPSRRRVLQAGGLLAGGGVLGALSADRASADVVGQVGTQQDRVDVFAGQVDADSVNTGKTTITGVSADSEHIDVSVDLSDISGTQLSDKRTQYTSSVGTSAASIYSGGKQGAICYVAGRDTGGGDETYFIDVLQYLHFGSSSIISQLSRSGAATRSYSVSGADLELTMGSSTYQVLVSARHLAAGV